MTFNEFKIATMDIEQFYEKPLNPTQVQMWYEELKNYDSDKYKSAIRYVCKKSQYRPTLSMILEALKNVKMSNEQREKVECKACGGTGYVLYHKVVDGIDYEYACQCNCQNAIGLDYDGQKVKDERYRSNYYLPKAVDVFKGAR